MAEGEVEKSEGMLATASLHHASVVKREHDQVSLNNQESDDDCSSLDSCGETGNMGVPDSRGHSPSPTLSDPAKHQLNGLLNLSTISSLQGLAGLQGTAPGPSAASMATPSGIINNQLINTPLNLSLNASNSMNTSNLMTSPQQVIPPQPTAMPQLILASGQIIQGIQGAQLLIPTSQGIATQTILTIPINAVTNNQMVNMPMSNGQVMTTTLANLAHQYAAHNNGGYNPSTSPTHGGLAGPAIPNPLPHLLNGHNQHQHHLLSAFQQQQQQQAAAAAAHQQQPQQQQLPQQPSQKSPLAHSPYNSGVNMSCKSPPVNGLSNGSSTTNPTSSPLNTISRLTASNSDLTITTTGPSTKCSSNTSSNNNNNNNNSSSNNNNNNANNNNNNSSASNNNSNNNNSTNGSSSTNSNSNCARESSNTSSSNSSNNNHSNNNSNNNNSNNNNNTATSNSNNSSSNNNNSATSNNNSGQQSTATPLPIHPPPPPQYQHSPSPLDLMDESNQPMISESRANMVDGINLDEIKEFAKAFKLRRLSLGLTQTQVGQALSITEGPAYSQSAICSALATQMYCAAQLASQQQSMFEKLDITPKSAQKIKPVLEQWMKEAEESRYKSGQNHLTEFIGVEPSKKRKRRTSFTPQALELLNAHFERNTHPSGTEITTLAHQLGYEREVIRIWFCNKRQALKNTVRMMSKGCT